MRLPSTTGEGPAGERPNLRLIARHEQRRLAIGVLAGAASDRAVTIDVATKLPVQRTGEFFLLREREVLPVKTERSLIDTRQVPEPTILQLARGTR